MLAEDAEASPRTHRLLFTPAKRTSLADAAAAVFSSPPITAPSDETPIKATAVTPTSDLPHAFGGTTSDATDDDTPTSATGTNAGLVTPTSSAKRSNSKSKPPKIICAVDGCTKQGVSSQNGKCNRHYNEELASARRSSKRAPKRSKVDIMMEFERKSEIPAVNRARKPSMDHIDEDNKAHSDKQVEQQSKRKVSMDAGGKSDEDSTAAEATESVSAVAKIEEIECDWRETIDATSGKPYYYHVQTNEVTWTKPSSLIVAEEVKAIAASTPSDYTANYHAPTEAADMPLDTAKAKPKTWGQGQWRGISQHNSRFKAAITVAGRTRHIGTFDNVDHAIWAYGYVKNILTSSGLDPTDREGRDVVFDAARIKAKELAEQTNTNSVNVPTSAPTMPSQPSRPVQISQGVFLTSSGEYRAEVSVNRVRKFIGVFNTAEQANCAYKSVRSAVDLKLGQPDGVDINAVFESARADALQKLTVGFDYSALVSKTKGKATEATMTTNATNGKAKPAKTKAVTKVAANAKPPAKHTAQTTPLPRGVQERSGRYATRIKVANIEKYIGTFDSAHAASYVYERIKGSLEAKKNRPNIDLNEVYESTKAQAMETISNMYHHADAKSDDHNFSLDQPFASVGPGSAKNQAAVDSQAVANSLPRGVRMRRDSGKFEAQVMYGGKKRYIGTFYTKEMAGAAYQVVRKTLDEFSFVQQGEFWFAKLKEEAYKAAQAVAKSPAVIVGSRVGIYWDLDKIYYPATVTALRASTRATLLYDDGHVDTVDLRKEHFKRLRGDAGVSAARPIPRSNTVITSSKNVVNDVVASMKVSAKPAAIAKKKGGPIKKASISKKHKPVAKGPKAINQVVCKHCGRQFGVEGLRYHLKHKVCLKGLDTSKTPKPGVVSSTTKTASKPVEKPPPANNKVTCEHCGRKFGVEGLKYHIQHHVCLKGKDTSKSERPAPQRK